MQHLPTKVVLPIVLFDLVEFSNFRYSCYESRGEAVKGRAVGPR